MHTPGNSSSLLTNLPPPAPAAPAHRPPAPPPTPPAPRAGLPCTSSSGSMYLPPPPLVRGESSPLRLPVLLRGDPARGRPPPPPPPPPPPRLLLPPRLLPTPLPPRAKPARPSPRPNLSSLPAGGAEKVKFEGTCTWRRARGTLPRCVWLWCACNSMARLKTTNFWAKDLSSQRPSTSTV